MLLGSFATAEEAALCVARSPEGQAAAETAAAAPPLTSEEARQQAQAEGLTLRVADSTTGYFGVHHHPGWSKPYQARVKRGGKRVTLGSFVTAREAALCVARSPEGREAAKRDAAVVAPLSSLERGGGAGRGHRDAARYRPQRGGRGPAHAARRIRQGRGGGPAHATRRVLQGGGGRPAHAARCGCQAGARGRRQGGGVLAGWPS
eukprot:scaffold20950_cov46-Phaeocystis_antarctica.AAC.2